MQDIQVYEETKQKMLLSLDVIAVSRAPSPKFNPNTLLPAKSIVIKYTLLKADEAELKWFFAGLTHSIRLVTKRKYLRIYGGVYTPLLHSI